MSQLSQQPDQTNQQLPDSVYILFRKVRNRLWLIRFMRLIRNLVLILCSLYGIILITSRTIYPFELSVTTLFLPFIVALLSSLIGSGLISYHKTARTIDRSAKLNDLYLTTLYLDNTSGSFKKLVKNEAIKKTRELQPKVIAPVHIFKPIKTTVIFLISLYAIFRFMPFFDLFNVGQHNKIKAEWNDRLRETRQATQSRVKIINKNDFRRQHSREVEEKLDTLLHTFKNINNDSNSGNLTRLGEQQKELGALWRSLKKSDLQQGLHHSIQQFGLYTSSRIQEWKNDVKKGDFASIKNEIKEISQLASKLQSLTDPVEKEKARSKLRNRLNQLSQFLAKEVHSPGISAALKRALEQSEMSSLEGLDQEALEALQETLDLADLELENLKQSIRDLEKLEEALQTVQLAKMADCRDGKCNLSCDSCNTLEDYTDLYTKIVQKQKNLIYGEGMKGVGTGRGGKAREAPEKSGTFQAEKARTSVGAGKVLLQWNTRGVTIQGPIEKEYEEALENVKQGISEAIINEDIPPSYHQIIQQYFDSLERPTDAKE